MSLESKKGLSYDNVRVFFEDLSDEAKEKALAHKGITTPQQANWDVFEMSILGQGVKTELSQCEIDMSALTMIGCYH